MTASMSHVSVFCLFLTALLKAYITQKKISGLKPYHHIHLKTLALELQNCLTKPKRSYLPEKKQFLSACTACSVLLFNNGKQSY